MINRYLLSLGLLLLTACGDTDPNGQLDDVGDVDERDGSAAEDVVADSGNHGDDTTTDTDSERDAGEGDTDLDVDDVEAVDVEDAEAGDENDDIANDVLEDIDVVDADAEPDSTDAATDAIADAATDATDATDATVDVVVPCIDDLDGNNAENTTFDLGAVSCTEDPLTRSAVLESGEFDWFRLTSADALGCDASARIDVLGELDASVCVYVVCDSGLVETLDCLAPATEATSPARRPGCCSSTNAVAFEFDCGTSDDADFYVSVGSTSAVCDAYSLRISP